MANVFTDCLFGVNPEDEHAYSVGGNTVSEFIIGNPADPEDFFLMGSRPLHESPLLPCISGRILNFEGERILTLVRNQIVDTDLYHLQWVHGAGVGLGFQIVDHAQGVLVSVSTASTHQESLNTEMMLTSLHGVFYGKDGGDPLASGTADGLAVKCRAWFPGMAIGDYTQQEINLIQVMLATGGKVNRIVTGAHRNERILMDGAFFIDATLDDCEAIIAEGHFVCKGECAITHSQVNFVRGSPAANVYDFLQMRG